jgi:hypothetical protein
MHTLLAIPSCYHFIATAPMAPSRTAVVRTREAGRSSCGANPPRRFVAFWMQHIRRGICYWSAVANDAAIGYIPGNAAHNSRNFGPVEDQLSVTFFMSNGSISFGIVNADSLAYHQVTSSPGFVTSNAQPMAIPITTIIASTSESRFIVHPYPDTWGFQ